MAIEFNADAALAKLGALAQQYGPKVVDLGSEVVRVDAIGNLIAGAVCAVLVAAIVGVNVVALPKARIAAKTYDVWPVLLWTFSGMGGGFLLAAALIQLANVWTWVAIYNPKLALAHQLLMKVSGQ